MRRPAKPPLVKPLLVIVALLAASPPALAEEIAVIVNTQRTTKLDREEIAQIFLKKRRFWDDGTPMLPVNQNAGSAARASFDTAVFGAGARRLSVYWNHAYFRGVLPPATLASDEAVRRFVVSEPRAIGYIRAGVVDASVRVISILTGSPP
jgi:ABC-type phosphate transport system substrate-binding protein